MGDVLSIGSGIALMATGMAMVGYATYLTMIRVDTMRGFNRAIALGPGGAAMIIIGLVLALV